MAMRAVIIFVVLAIGSRMCPALCSYILLPVDASIRIAAFAEVESVALVAATVVHSINERAVAVKISARIIATERTKAAIFDVW